jgi:DNA-binding LacI/PurR family transcriptional regulator/DNA-binding transcriptional regulator YhcF (GntR family)
MKIPVRTTLKKSKAMMQAPAKALHEQVARRLEAELPVFQGCYLPSIRELCDRYGVSNKTMIKAAAILRDKGLLSYSRGRAIKIAGRVKLAGSASRSLEMTVRSFVEEKIRNATFKAGQRLPKRQYFISECGVSRETVYDALVKLENEGLVHRERKRWYAGPPLPQSSHVFQFAAQSRLQRPTVVLVVADYESYLACANHHFDRQIFQTMQLELNKFGIDTAVAIGYKGTTPGAFPMGKQEIAGFIRKLGSRYIGGLIYSSFREFPDYGEWLHLLNAFRKPAGIIDGTSDTNSGIPPALRKGCFRAYVSQAISACMAVDILYAAGHRSIALITNTLFEKEAWWQNRRRFMLDYARTIGKSLRFSDVVMCVPPSLQPQNEWLDWKDSQQRMLQRIESIRKLLELTPQAEEAIKRQLIKDQPSLKQMVSREQHTAVIAANDEVAVDFTLWMKYTGLGIQNGLSLISFDNNPILALQRFSTLDFGHTDLGYLVAHQFIGDILVQKDANGNIASTPRFFDRGSIVATDRKFPFSR